MRRSNLELRPNIVRSGYDSTVEQSVWVGCTIVFSLVGGTKLKI